MLHTCDTCGYSTKRLWTFNNHLSRKNKCEYVEKVDVTTAVNACKQCNKIMSTLKALKKHELTCSLNCPTCLKLFSDKTAKSRHINTIACTPPNNHDVLDTYEEENKRLKQEIEVLKLKSDPPIQIINNITNNTNNTTNIQYNNYDKPYTDHITNKVMKRIFENSQKDPSLILNETVRCIYKNDNHPENHVIKIGEKTALSKVFKDGKEIWLPMDGVIQTVLSNTGDFCADRLRDCHEEGDIEGTRVVVVWKLLEVLGTDDREEDCVNRSSYIQSIKAAFL